MRITLLIKQVIAPKEQREFLIPRHEDFEGYTVLSGVNANEKVKWIHKIPILNSFIHQQYFVVLTKKHEFYKKGMYVNMDLMPFFVIREGCFLIKDERL